MFKIVAEPTFTCDVNLSRPDADTPVAVKITWRHKGTKEVVQWVKRAPEMSDDAAILDEVIVEWSGFVDEAGAPVKYSKAALGTLLAAFPASGRELYLAYYRRLTDARAKN